ncbi:MAG: hypothetical protein HUJ69_03070, partial [Lachnospiraceae bacterium]|nr:hypothetical protein [Lachnospiraceae bacterium]
INRFREILDEEIAGMEDGMMQSGNRTATSRVLSYFSAYNAYIQKISGIDYYRFLKDIRESLKTDAPAVLEQLKETADIILRTDNLRIRLTLDEENLSPVSNKLEVFLKELPAGSSPLASPEVVRFVPEKKNEGFITPAKVQYVAEGGETAIPYSGHAAVLLQITRLNYLWNQVRVMGGAYGCSATIDRHGRITMSSYRDPNLAETLQVYEKSGEVLSAFEADEQEMLKYIIGTLAGLDPVMTVSMKGTLANDALETGLTGEHLLKSSREVLSTTPEDVRKAAAAFTEAMGHHCICVVGSETKIRENAHLLDHVETLF